MFRTSIDEAKQAVPDASLTAGGGLKKVLFLLLLIIVIGFIAVTSRTRSAPAVPENSDPETSVGR